MKLAWSLPALDKLDEAQLDQVWRLAGGHPRSLEYLDALLSGGTARYPDVTARLHQAISRRLDGADEERWLAARTGLDAALAQTVALAADDVLLDDLLARLAQVPGAADLLLGVSVYREPVDVNGVLFQAGQPDPAAENVPDRAAASQRITEILTAAGITVDESFDLASVPEQVRAQLAPHLAELNRAPVPPLRPPPGWPSGRRRARRPACSRSASRAKDSGSSCTGGPPPNSPAGPPPPMTRGWGRRTGRPPPTGSGGSRSGPRTGPLMCMTCSKPATTCSQPVTARTRIKSPGTSAFSCTPGGRGIRKPR